MSDSLFVTLANPKTWLGLSDGRGVQSTELKPLLRMGPLKHAWRTTSGTEHRKVCSLWHEQRSSGDSLVSPSGQLMCFQTENEPVYSY